MLLSRLCGAAAALTLVVASGAARAIEPPQPGPPVPPITQPRDIPYPGTLQLAVDATDLEHALVKVHETIPTPAAGDLVLLYPRWVPEAHAPVSPIDKLAGLVVTTEHGQRLAWRRDPVDVHAFHIEVPAGVASVVADFQFLSPVSSREGRVMMTREMLNVEWFTVALYPAGYFSRDIPVQAQITLPAGFSLATALETQAAEGARTIFKPTTFNTLVDSPLIAGRYVRKFDLDPGGPARVTLDVIADRPEELEASASAIADHRNLVRQAYRLFGSHHYDHYDFLLTISDRLGGAGDEHHQSSEDGVSTRYFLDYDTQISGHDLLPHEYTHSWNGKFRRPADQWTPNFNVPMGNSLLWVYEGQTQYWGYVLAARSGLLSRQEALDAIALTAASYDLRVGRTWRALEDTGLDPIIASRRPLSWLSWQRSEDYYSEGELIWLDADTLIRQLSGGRRSLDDFAQRFFGVDNGSMVTETFTFDDVVRTLAAVQPYDWASFLRQRLEGHGPGAPLDGLARGGYRLVYTPEPTAYFKANETRRHIVDLSFSLGMIVDASEASRGMITDVQWDGPAFKAGLTADAKLLAVNGETYTPERLRDAVKSRQPVDLLVSDKDEVRTVRIDYVRGPLYPRLERIGAGRSSLEDLLAPRP